jgi:hypothetical protein
MCSDVGTSPEPRLQDNLSSATTPLTWGSGYRGPIERRQLHLYLLGFASHPGAIMTVKIDGVEPNIFPHVDDLDARDAGRNVEVFLDVTIEGKPTPVTVELSYKQASDLAILLEPFRKL